jgi:tetratricopeptide (TPR) repeat protein
VGDRLGQGWLLDVSAHAQAGLGDLAGAEAAYRQAWHTHRRLGQPQLAAESLAGLARLALAQGDLARAQAWVQQILAIEAANGLDGAHELFRIYLSCYQVLAACQEPQADQLLGRASAHWQRYSERIPGAELRQSFLENVTARRQLSAAYQARQACQQVSLPAAGAPLRRSLRPEEYVSVCWTLHTPEDQAIPAKAARRQHRLLRLIQEAHRQGAVPAYPDLADALGVSTRTIERDMAALTRQGHQIPATRGKMSA